MNISYNWLKQYIDLTETPQQVADILTSIGLEVDGVEPVEQVKGGLRGIVIGRVLTCVAHENSDHLHVTTVDLGPELGVQQIVCGARNVAAGQTVVVATIGAVLYQGDESFTIKRAKMRGVESNGMICAEDEIGLGTGHDGIIVLTEPVAPGTPASQYFRLEDDAMIEVDITPNRADAISHYGVARDLNAYFAARGEERHLRRPQVEPLQAECDDLNIKVTVENTEACPIYSGVSIVGVQIAPSPEWMQKALRAVGLKPINNVVDATNYVMMELGQSLHSFDADKIKGRHIVVRNVAQDTPFTTLDGVERKLDAQDLLICNAEEPMCLAGVFGGLDSGITDQTVNVFLESAYFNPVTIRKTARRHGLSTDASFRYERGCDPNNTRFVLTRCANLIRQVAGGRISGDIVEVRSQDFPPFEVSMSLKKADSLIGKQIGQATVERILAALEIGVKSFDGDVYELLVPQYRVDVRRDVDVIEDLLRIYGYNNVEYSQKLNSSLSYSRKPDSNQLQNRISDMLSAQGFYEIMNNSLTKTSYYENNEAYPLSRCVSVMNPLSQDLGVMRQSLLYGGLESIARNVNRKHADLKLYEFGNCYHYDSAAEQEGQPLAAYSEEMHLAFWLTGNKAAQSWTQAETKSTFFELKAYVFNVMRRLGVDTDRLSLLPLTEVQGTLFGEGVILMLGQQEFGYIASINKAVRRQFGIDAEVFYADLLWSRLMQQNKRYKMEYREMSNFPEVRRDFALLLDKSVKFADLRQLAMQTERKLLKRVNLFDVYEGKNLPAGKKSYALSFFLQDENKTLEDRQIDNIMSRLQKAFEEKFGATLR